MKIKIALAATVAILAAAAPASAATITYTFEGTFAGTIDGNGFSNTAAKFVGIGDTATASDINGSHNVVLSSLKAFSGGQTYTISGTSLNFRNQISGPYAGFVLTDAAGNGPSPFVTSDAALVPYDGKSNFTTRTVATFPGAYNSFQTDHGLVQFTDVSNVTFGAQIGAVPEPATWALMIGGFGMVGGTLRRRKTSMRVTFA